MLILREVLEFDAWPDALDMGFAPPQLDFVTADMMEAERAEEPQNFTQRKERQ